MRTKDQRVTCALKWHYLDNLDVEAIQERFAEHDVDLAQSTIRGYLNEKPKEAVIEQIEQEHANVRLQIAEREERKHQRAREAEAQATQDEPIKRVVPQTETVPADADGPIMAHDWEVLDEDDPDRPEWADDRDVIIRFVDERREVYPGESYPTPSIDGSPKYTTEFVGLRRDQPDLQGQAMARREQSQHLEARGDVLGVYSTDINLNAEIESEQTVSLDEDTAAAVRAATLQEGADE